MVTKDPNSGLLSKVARFVRNPTTDWSELGVVESERESGYSKEALKEMIERKRQNDFVRKREFDVLRKLRRNEPVISSDNASRPSFFQSSQSANQGERAMTIKKIDEIEAQMSKQWWKGKQDGATNRAPAPAAANEAEVSTFAPHGVVNTFAPTQTADHLPQAMHAPGLEFEATRPGTPGPGDSARMSDRQSDVASKDVASERGLGNSGFSNSDLFSIELRDDWADPDLEEAAIRFANGDDAGAEAALLGALQADNVQAVMADTWASALFDLYRATGQEQSFDRVAIDYAQRFGRSAPAWFSTPELLGKNVEKPVGKANPSGARPFVWDCPPDLDRSTLQALRAELPSAAMPWYFNWTAFDNVTAEAISELAALFSQWCEQPVLLQFGGVEALQSGLRARTPSGDARIDPCWWQLRLNAMRILHQQDEFELAALDYCVTYEVSPPPWTDPRCEYVYDAVPLSEQSTVASEALDSTLPIPASFDTSRLSSTELDTLPLALVELCGEVIGDASDALSAFQPGSGTGRLVVSCARLIRVDFSAAGSILNWVAARESEGCAVQFMEVPRLVAAFFNVIGISEHARITLRSK